MSREFSQKLLESGAIFALDVVAGAPTERKISADQRLRATTLRKISLKPREVAEKCAIAQDLVGTLSHRLGASGCENVTVEGKVGGMGMVDIPMRNHGDPCVQCHFCGTLTVG